MGVGHGGLTDPGRKPGVNETGTHKLGGVPGAVGPEKPGAMPFYCGTANGEWRGVRYGGYQIAADGYLKPHPRNPRTRMIKYLTVAAALAAAPLAAQQPAAPASPPDPTPLAVCTVAPDFTLNGATRYGVLRANINITEY